MAPKLPGSEILLLDAATGTELARRGVDTSPPLWSARAIESAPAILVEIHTAEAEAGADILTANTFRTHKRNLARAGIGSLSRVWAKRAVELAREGGRLGRALSNEPARRILVAGSLAPLEDCYRPDLVPDERTLTSEHADQVECLMSAGVDLILVETMSSVRELVTASRLAAQSGVPVFSSAVTDGQGFLLSGETLEEAARALLRLPRPPAALGVNCVPARHLSGELARLARVSGDAPLLVYGNTGRPLDERAGRFTEPIEPEDYAMMALDWVRVGARVIGGCCGTGAAHTRALRHALDTQGK